MVLNGVLDIVVRVSTKSGRRRKACPSPPRATGTETESPRSPAHKLAGSILDVDGSGFGSLNTVAQVVYARVSNSY